MKEMTKAAWFIVSLVLIGLVLSLLFYGGLAYIILKMIQGMFL